MKPSDPYIIVVRTTTQRAAAMMDPNPERLVPCSWVPK